MTRRQTPLTPAQRLRRVRAILRELPEIYAVFPLDGGEYVRAEDMAYFHAKLKDIAQAAGVKWGRG